MDAVVRPGEVTGSILAPSSKSISHRALLRALLARGRSTIQNLSRCADVIATLEACRAFGAEVGEDAELITLHGCGPELTVPDGTIDCANSGTTLRFFTVAGCLAPGAVRLTGDRSLTQRPMEPLLAALRGLGAEARRDADGSVTVRGPLRPGSTNLDATASSQYLSAMLLVLPVLEGDWRIDLAGPLASRGYVDLTLEALDDPSYVRLDEGGATIEGGIEYRSIERTIEGDWSAAAFPVAAGLLGGDVRVQGLVKSSRQPDRALLELIDLLNGEVSWEGSTLIARRSELNGVDLDVSDTPDLFPAVLLLAARARGTTTITGTDRLRYKESDRVYTCTDVLRAMGADIAVGDDRVVVRGVPSLRGAEVTSHGDHRVAMMAVTAGLGATGATTVQDMDCVDVSWPGFLEALKGLGGRVRTTAPLP